MSDSLVGASEILGGAVLLVGILFLVGLKVAPRGETVECPYCGGDGGFGQCPFCAGSGRMVIPKSAVDEVHGDGQRSEPKSIRSRND